MFTKNIKKTPIAIAITSAFLSTSLFAGQIVTDADSGLDLDTATSTPDKQYGFGGWNFDNVAVRIVNISDFSTPIAKSFDVTSGTYTAMGVDESFESVISTGGEERGHLHGKDWPVGEPAGIKVINGDLKTQNGKPENCIMTSSYLEAGYLDAAVTKPVLCSSPFQTHKRFKVNLLPLTVDGVVADYGKPVDLVFNLDPNDVSTEIVRYQILQKLNNYTGARLDGYKVEVFAADGITKVPELTLSMGIGENTKKLDVDGNPTDIWKVEDMANFSHGLWGPADDHFDTNGFFDSTRAYFTPTLDATNQSISYTGDMLGGNYDDIFGNWLPSIWEPTGIFHDADNDPETDADLKAFWGNPTGALTNAWHKGNEEGWAEATEADFLTWSGELYEQGPVEDVLNLGLNYIVNVGENAKIGSTFTIRITPHVAPLAEQVEPSYVTVDAAPLSGTTSYESSEGIIVVDMTLPEEVVIEEPVTEVVVEAKAAAIVPTEIFLTSTGVINIGVADADLNKDPAVAEEVTVTIKSEHGDETKTVILTESDDNSARFVGTVNVELSDVSSDGKAAKFNINQNTRLTATYEDKDNGTGAAATAEATLDIAVKSAVVDPVVDDGSSSFAAYDNKSFLVMLFGFLGLGGLIARRRLSKSNK